MPVFTIKPLSHDLEKLLGEETFRARKVACQFEGCALIVEEVLETAALFPDTRRRRDAIRAVLSWLDHLAVIQIRAGRKPEIAGRDISSSRSYAWWLQKD